MKKLKIKILIVALISTRFVIAQDVSLSYSTAIEEGMDQTILDPDHKLIVLFFTQSPGESNAYANRFFQLVQASIK